MNALRCRVYSCLMPGFSELQAQLDSFYAERDWRQFQTAKDVAAALAIEASELQQLFLWLQPHEQQRVLAERRDDIALELADVVINCLNLAYLANVDLEHAVIQKLVLLADKYPAATARGKVVSHP